MAAEVRTSSARILTSGRNLYVPFWPGLGPFQLLRNGKERPVPFPMEAPHRACFYLARYGIYHLFRALALRPGESVLVPDYHHGNEVAAIRAAGASLRFYPIRSSLEPDLDRLDRLCRGGARVLYVIHYLGWPQPIEPLLALCRERGLLLIEDCALSLLSATGGRPLGSFGGYAAFCLYKTLPVPNGGLVVQNRGAGGLLGRLSLRGCGPASLAAGMAELSLRRLRSRRRLLGGALVRLKRAAGRALGRLRVRRVPVGDQGFRLEDADLGMSAASGWLLRRLDYRAIRDRRRENFLHLQSLLGAGAAVLRRDLPEGVCPLFLPLLVEDKHGAARALQARGIEAVEFWNRGDPVGEEAEGEDARFLRRHVLELPIHQDLTASHLEYLGAQVRALRLDRPGALSAPGGALRRVVGGSG